VDNEGQGSRRNTADLIKQIQVMSIQIRDSRVSDSMAFFELILIGM
jgi:hypothetical protein